MITTATRWLFVCCLAFTFACQPTPEQESVATEATEQAAEVKVKTVSNAEEEAPKEGVGVGDKAPAFNLKGLDGEMHSFDNIKDANGEPAKGFIVTFTCNTCPYAVAYEDRLIELNDKMSAVGYPVVAIQPNDPEVKAGDSYEAMQQRAEEKGFTFLYLDDGAQEIYPQYGATRTPEVYLVDGDGIVRYQGAIDDNHQDAAAVTVNYVEKAVEAIEAGRDPEPSYVKAIGCTIKTKKT